MVEELASSSPTGTTGSPSTPGGPFAKKLEEAAALVQVALGKHPVSAIALTFNGGKDSVVAMELVIDAVGIEAVRSMCVFMFEESNEFEELVEYREQYLVQRGLKLTIVPKEEGWAGGLSRLKEQFGLEAVVIGTRSTDPDGQRQSGPIAETTGNFPKMIRYCPVFHWTYDDVWRYLMEEKKIQSCTLYEKGYSSLGSKASTQPNPKLYDEATKTFLPAWKLKDGCIHERAGRVSKPSL